MPFDSLTYEEPGTEKLPTFPARRNQSRLDLRPAIWSLRNRPEEWDWQTRDITIMHKPSQHEFWVGNGVMFCELYRANCSCTSRRSASRPIWRDRFAFMWAYRAWRRQGNAASYDINRQFAEHFLTPREIAR